MGEKTGIRDQGSEIRGQRSDAGDYRVAVSLSAVELRLLRRAIAKATDQGEIAWNQGLSRIAELDVLRWNALEDERQSLALTGAR